MVRKNQRRKLHSPNVKLYVSLALPTLFAVSLLFLILLSNLDNNSIIAIVSALISILGGALASIIVGWLIDATIYQSRNAMLEKREAALLNYISIFLDDLFQSFADVCIKINPLEDQAEENWEFWFSRFVKYKSNVSPGDFFDTMVITYVALNEIVSLVDQINSGEMQEYFIATSSSVPNEMLILQDSCRKIRDKLFISSKKQLTPQEESFFIFTIRDVLSTLICLYKLENKKYAPRR